jgi:uncharacterized integral membrane protein
MKIPGIVSKTTYKIQNFLSISLSIGRKLVIKIIFLILLIILGATFSTLNRQEISLHYFWGWNTGAFPLYVLILASLLVGIVAGFSFGWKKRWELRSRTRDLGERAKTLKNDLQTLAQKEEHPEEASPSPEVGKPPLA